LQTALAFANAVAGVGKEKEDYYGKFLLGSKIYMICSCSLNPVWVLSTLGVSRIWRTQTFITYNGPRLGSVQHPSGLFHLKDTDSIK